MSSSELAYALDRNVRSDLAVLGPLDTPFSQSLSLLGFSESHGPDSLRLEHASRPILSSTMAMACGYEFIFPIFTCSGTGVVYHPFNIKFLDGLAWFQSPPSPLPDDVSSLTDVYQGDEALRAL